MRFPLGLAKETAADWARRPPFLYPAARHLIAESERSDLGGRAALQLRLLSRMLRAARGAPAFRGLHASALSDIPLLAKDTLRGRPGDYLGGMQFPVYRSHTSGTTGTSIEVRRSISCIVFEHAAIDWVASQAGFSFARDRIAVFRGANIKRLDDLSPPFWETSSSGRVMTFSSNHLSARTFPDFAQALQAFRPTILFAYPSVAEQLARLADDAGVAIKIPMLLTSSETLSTQSRRRLADAFQAVTVDYYGQAERVAFAYSLQPGAYRFMPSYGIVELEPAIDAQSGFEIVGTPLHNTAQFLLRYRTGDTIGVPARDADLRAIALGLESFGGVSGRVNDVLHGPHGEVFVGIDHIPRGLERFGRFQFVQAAPDRIVIRVSGHAQGTAEDAAIILASARRKLPASLGVEVRFDEDLGRTASGKTPLVLRDYAPAG